MDKPRYTGNNVVYWGGPIPDVSYREKGPSWVSAAGVVIFEGNKKNPGVMSRAVGPAYIDYNGNIGYRVDGHLHRVDGPASVYVDGNKVYYVNGARVTQLEFFTTYGVM